MSTKIVPFPRRPGRRDFLTIGAGAAAVVAGLKVPPSVGAVADPVLPLAEKRRALLVKLQPLDDLSNDMLPSDPRYSAVCEALLAGYNNLAGIEREILATAATSLRGITEQ